MYLLVLEVWQPMPPEEVEKKDMVIVKGLTNYESFTRCSWY